MRADLPYTCPNGHEFPRAVAVPCEHCEASVVCVPHSDAIRLHDALDDAERALMQARAEAAKLAAANTRLREALERILRALLKDPTFDYNDDPEALISVRVAGEDDDLIRVWSELDENDRERVREIRRVLAQIDTRGEGS